MRWLALALVSVMVLSGCKGEKGDTGATGPAGTSPSQAPEPEVLIFTGPINFHPTTIGVGSWTNDVLVSVYIAFSGQPNDWIELGAPTGDNSVTTTPWYSSNPVDGTVAIYNVVSPARYKIFVIPYVRLTSFEGLSDRFEN